METLPLKSGLSTKTCLSNLPGLRSALSKTSGRFVAASTITGGIDAYDKFISGAMDAGTFGVNMASSSVSLTSSVYNSYTADKLKYEARASRAEVARLEEETSELEKEQDETLGEGTRYSRGLPLSIYDIDMAFDKEIDNMYARLYGENLWGDNAYEEYYKGDTQISDYDRFK